MTLPHPESRVMPDMSKVIEAIRVHEAFCDKAWATINELVYGDNTDVVTPTVLALMDEMSVSARKVGTAFYEATKDRNSLENCLIGCGWSKDRKSGAPDAIPEFIRECAKRWAFSHID